MGEKLPFTANLASDAIVEAVHFANELDEGDFSERTRSGTAGRAEKHLFAPRAPRGAPQHGIQTASDFASAQSRRRQFHVKKKSTLNLFSTRGLQVVQVRGYKLKGGGR